MVDHAYQIDDLRVDLFVETATCTFYFAQGRVFANDYFFEGSSVGSRACIMMVFAKARDGWKITHEHPSRFPE